jgi:copper chaperone CopZ
MDLNATIDFIIKDLKEAGDIIDDLKQYPGVPELQVELAKSKCRSASEVISLFRNLPGNVTRIREETSVPREVTRKFKEPEKTNVSEHIEEVNKIEIVESNVKDISAEANEKQAQTTKEPVESAIIADKYLNMPESYYEKFRGSKHEDDVLEILHTKPLQSLNEAIGINDKFLFIREIFNGNGELYNQAIIKLESVGNLAEARSVVMSYTGDNTENEAIAQLLDLIKRKFPSNE